MDNIDYLINYLLNERNEKINLKELSMEEKRNLFRSLCNVRPPIKISENFLNVQDKYLKEELKKKGIVDDTKYERIQKRFIY